MATSPLFVSQRLFPILTIPFCWVGGMVLRYSGNGEHVLQDVWPVAEYEQMVYFFFLCLVVVQHVSFSFQDCWAYGARLRMGDWSPREIRCR